MPSSALSVVGGALWSAANLWCLTRLLNAWLGPRCSRRRVVGWLLLKFPLLYVAVFLLLRSPALSVAGFSVGFTLVLIAAIGWLAVRAQRLSTLRPHGR